MTNLEQLRQRFMASNSRYGFIELMDIIEIDDGQPLRRLIGVKYRIIFKSDQDALLRFRDHLKDAYGWTEFTGDGSGNIDGKQEFVYTFRPDNADAWHILDMTRELWVADKSVYDDFLVTEKLKGNLL